MRVWSEPAWLFVCLMLFFGSASVAQTPDEEEEQPAAAADTYQESILTDEQLDQLLRQVDRFFIDQGMASLTLEVDLYRDPSNRLNSENIREGDPSRLAGLSRIVSHYTYRYPDFYELTIMGYVLAGSEVPPDRTFYSQMIPMPGAPIYTDDLRARFDIKCEGIEDVEGVPAYKIRYTALQRETEFFDYLVYYIDVERKVILRVEGAFDNYWYRGSAGGNFYYDNWLGKYLPVYGHGTVLFYPNRRMNVWAKWRRWEWQAEEETISESSQESASGS